MQTTATQPDLLSHIWLGKLTFNAHGGSFSLRSPARESGDFMAFSPAEMDVGQGPACRFLRLPPGWAFVVESPPPVMPRDTLICSTVLCPEVRPSSLLFPEECMAWDFLCVTSHHKLPFVFFLFLHSGFCIEVMCALTVLVASNVGIPISSTHCKVLEFAVVTPINYTLRTFTGKDLNYLVLPPILPSLCRTLSSFLKCETTMEFLLA